MSSKVDICNMALSSCGVSAFIQDMDEGSAEAKVCKANYDAALGQILRTYPWPFATKHLSLSLLGERQVTNWQYVYAYPADCVKAHGLAIPGCRLPDIQQAIPFQVANHRDAKVILTDQAAAELVYTARVENTGLYDDQFSEAFANLLASRITATFGRPEQQNSLLQAYYALAAEAFASAMNEGCQGPEPDSFLLRARQ